MKALTVCQPYATLIARGIKRVENRTWHAPASMIGQRIAIHAGKSKNWLTPGNYGIPTAELPFGAVVAVATLAACVELDDGIVPQLAAQRFPWMDIHEHVEGPVCWVLTSVEALPQPIPYSGAQGFWNFPDELLK